MAELGADDRIIADALTARPDYTATQVRNLWGWCQVRIRRSGGQLTEGIFFHALRSGQLAPPPPDSASPPVVNDADDDRAFNAAYRRARALAPPGTAHADMTELIYAILDGASDEQALDVLAARGAP
jgi:hypothetical protein